MFFLRCTGASGTGYIEAYRQLCKVSLQRNVSKMQVACLTRASHRKPDDIPNIPVFPYHRKRYHWLNMVLDTNQPRVHKESKVIVVDGPPACGKHELAKQLAEEFDFLYLPQAHFDDLLISHWGFDWRSLDDKVPVSTQTCDIAKFLKDPHGPNVGAMQLNMLLLRKMKYMAALRHILCTGEGVVTVRTPWSDRVFAKAMYQNGYLNKALWGAYNDSAEVALGYYLFPHLVIYMDVPVSKTQQNIKKKGLSYEVNSKVLTDKYLEDIKNNYKTDYLNPMNLKSHLLVYDWSDGGDVEIVVEDIENINFDNLPRGDTRLSDWKFQHLAHKLHINWYTEKSFQILRQFDIPRSDIPELNISGEDWAMYEVEYNKIPDSHYQPGYNPYRGDTGMWWKNDELLFTDYVTRLIEKRKQQKLAQKG